MIILVDCHHKDNRGDILKAVDPFLTLGALATDVHHAVSQFANKEDSLGDSGRLDSRPENILIGWYKISLGKPLNGIEIAFGLDLKNVHLLSSRVVELILAGTSKAGLDTRVFPEQFKSPGNFGWKVGKIKGVGKLKY